METDAIKIRTEAINGTEMRVTQLLSRLHNKSANEVVTLRQSVPQNMYRNEVTAKLISHPQKAHNSKPNNKTKTSFSFQSQQMIITKLVYKKQIIQMMAHVTTNTPHID